MGDVCEVVACFKDTTINHVVAGRVAGGLEGFAYIYRVVGSGEDAGSSSNTISLEETSEDNWKIVSSCP